MDPRSASLWRRLLVLGPAPEYCLVAHEASAGVAEHAVARGLERPARSSVRFSTAAELCPGLAGQPWTILNVLVCLAPVSPAEFVGAESIW